MLVIITFLLHVAQNIVGIDGMAVSRLPGPTLRSSALEHDMSHICDGLHMASTSSRTLSLRCLCDVYFGLWVLSGFT